MNIRKRALRAGVIMIALAATSVTALLGSPTAGADPAPYQPPWQAFANVNHDPDAAGTLSFFDSSGTQIYHGNIHDAPIAAYIVGSQTIEDGDTLSSLYGYLPVANSPAAGWSGEPIGAASTYPNAGAPAGVSQTLPVFTGAATSAPITDLISDFPNPSTDPDFQGVYELRLRTIKPGSPRPSGYDVADIKVTGDLWQDVYPGTLTATNTALAVSPPTGAVAGGQTTLTATVTSGVPGTVQFTDGATALGAPVPVAAGQAAKTITLGTAGTHAYTATFSPSDLNTYLASQGTTSSVVGKSATTTTATVSPAKTVYGKAFTVQATVTSPGLVPTGSVTLSYGKTKLATKTLANGSASLTVPATALAPGSRALAISYGGSANSTASSTSKTVTVAKATSKTTNTLKPKKVITTKHAKLTVHVSVSGTTATGNVKIYDGSKVIKSLTLKASNKGKVVVTLPKLKAGKHKIYAVYDGSALVAASSAAKVTLTVTKKK